MAQSLAPSGLVFVDIKENTSPFDLVSEWLEDAKNHGIPKVVMNLATSSKSGEVTNRSVMLKEYKNNKFLFLTDNRTTKAVQIDENPKVASCMVLQYLKGGKYITRQIRFEGIAQKLPKAETEKYWNKDLLISHIRTLVGYPIGKVDRDEKIRRHDELLKQAESGVSFPLPEHHAIFEITPNTFKFYYGVDLLVADSLEFRKGADNKWTFERVKIIHIKPEAVEVN